MIQAKQLAAHVPPFDDVQREAMTIVSLPVWMISKGEIAGSSLSRRRADGNASSETMNVNGQHSACQKLGIVNHWGLLQGCRA